VLYGDLQCGARPPEPVEATTGLVFLGMDMIGRQVVATRAATSLRFSSALPTGGLQTPPHSPYISLLMLIPILNQHFGQGIVARIAYTRLIKFGDSNSNCGNIIGSYNRIVHGSDGGAQIMR